MSKQKPNKKIDMKNFKDLSKIKVAANKVQILYEDHVFDKDDNEVINDCDITGRHKPHADLLSALAALRKHVIEICEMGPSTKPKSIEVKGINLSGLEGDDTAKMVIISQKRLKDNKVFNINTPLTTLIDEEQYPLAEDLDKKCANIRKEALAYLEGKHAPSAQKNLFEDGDKESGLAVDSNGDVVKDNGLFS